MMRRRAVLLAAALVGVRALAAQQVTGFEAQPIGALQKVSAEGLVRSISAARVLSGGRILVSDLQAKRVVILDSTLSRATPVGDGDGAEGLGGAVAMRGDTTLVVHQKARALLVVDGSGRVVRTTAMPRPRDAAYLYGASFGVPAFDPQGRLVYRGDAWLPFQPPGPDGVPLPPNQADSAPIVRLNLASRAVDTVGFYRIITELLRMGATRDGRYWMTVTRHPLPTSDAWAVLRDGTVAILRGRDYHLDWVAPDGQRRSSPRMPYPWVPLSPSRKVAYRDSVATAAAAMDRSQRKSGEDTVTAPRTVIPPADSMPDYLPAFGGPGVAGAIMRADPSDRLWVRTNRLVSGGSVYDVIDRHAQVVQRVIVPTGRVLVGFTEGGQLLLAVRRGDWTVLEVASVERGVTGRIHD